LPRLAAFVTSILTQPRGRLDAEEAAEPPLRQVIDVLQQVMCIHDAEKRAISVLEIAATPPSKSHTLMDVFDIDFIAEDGTKRFVSELHASEGGMYHLTARLFHEQKLINSKLASCYVAPLEE
jgi:hypothetical protein